MYSRLEKARQAPDSMKGRILASACKLFGEYGFHGVTTRLIAKEVGIDVSTLHYHWGDKQDLYEAVLTDLVDGIREKFSEIDELVHGKPVDARLEVVFDILADHFYQNPEAAKLILSSYFSKTRIRSVLETRMTEHMTEHLSKIAVTLGLAQDQSQVPLQANARILAAWTVVINFVACVNYFRPLLNLDHAAYLDMVKETQKLIVNPALTKSEP